MEVSSNGKRSIYCLSYFNSRICKCIAILLVIPLIVRAIFFPSILSFGRIEENGLVVVRNLSPLYGSDFGIRIDKFLEVPQIVWGLNNQKIAFARACLTARMLNRTLLMPSLSASSSIKKLSVWNQFPLTRSFNLKSSILAVMGLFNWVTIWIFQI